MKMILRQRAWNAKVTVLALAAVASSSILGVLNAQAPSQWGANASKFGVAVVDISAIFKRHVRFKATMDGMKKEMEAIETELKADRDNITKAEQHKNSLKPGTPDYKQADEQVARMMADFQLKMGSRRKDFMDREAKVYYQTYQEVVQMVDYYAKRQNIGLVLRFSSEPVDQNRREDVLREINKPVVMQNSVDITGDVLALLNQGQQPATTPGVTAPQPQQQLPQARRPVGAQIPAR